MLDNTDRRILEELLQNGRMSMKELGQKIHMTGQATANRLLKLEEEGVIEGYTIRLNHAKAGNPVHTFINIYTKEFDHRPFLSFIETQRSYLVNNFKISGEGCYLLEYRFPSNEELDLFLTELNKYVNYKLSIVINKNNLT
ncbi:Lrp/AsnC family transcriptional regulator [Paenibacillus sp. MER TA 81-3]|uniref:Lrp/AsnC family transcriptional regulator n=1 Tax=Paenibacillus sp. MER TA 81-3 TaxID=2939573 RepID=UPI00203D1087|nr:Lrp/AsnC family transcriptional regulator [Paenibacillus sp. MER TA 81-3]MCM3339326.1 Lrp/AsnC family transcriptional regulator [Paenibacillus sp. MER TA 81-3]